METLLASANAIAEKLKGAQGDDRDCRIIGRRFDCGFAAVGSGGFRLLLGWRSRLYAAGA